MPAKEYVAPGVSVTRLIRLAPALATLVSTHSLNSIVTDSSPWAAGYSSGNKGNNNQQGVFSDDTTDVFDATPGAFGTHTSNRGAGAGTGIVDHYLDETVASGLRVLMGGGRKWFLPQGTHGSARAKGSDYVLPDELASG